MSARLDAPLDPGALNLRMQVLEPVKTDDGMGGGVTSYVHRRSVWARFEPDGPNVASQSPLRDGLARGHVRMALGLAPPAGWQLTWSALGGTRTIIVDAIQRGTPADPFDLCLVHEVVAEAAS